MNYQAFWTGFVIAAVLLVASPFSADESSARAASLAERLAGIEVELPGGGQALVLPRAGGEPPGSREVLLTAEKLASCLETVSEAEAWPAAWLVVQRADLDSDLVMRVELDDRGEVATPEFLFVVPRREWQPDDLPRVVREATGRKPPREGRGNLVIQGFSTRVVTTHVYELPEPGANVRGLRALLPPGALIRESRAVNLDDGRRYTLALVLFDATFVPSECNDCASEVFGHADSGSVRLVLTDEEQLVDEIDLTAHLRGVDGTPRLPRYPCDEGHARASVQTLLSREPTVSLLGLTDSDGDGRTLEVELPAEIVDCRKYSKLIVRITDGPSLRVLGMKESLLP